MYGHPSLGIYGQKSNGKTKRKPGRPSNKSRFLEKQGDLFLAEQYLAFVSAAFKASPCDASPQRGTSEDSHQGEALLGKPIRDLPPNGSASDE